MGLETGLLIASAATSIAGGLSSMAAGREQAEAQVEQTEDAMRQRTRKTMELEKIQKLNYLKSGVSLEGSPLLIMAETRDIGAQDVTNIRDSGQDAASSYISQGRQSLFSSVGQAAGSMAGGFGGAEDMAGQSVSKNPTLYAPARKPRF